MLSNEDLLTGVRWKIMHALSQGSLSAAQIAKKTQATLPSISQSIHLLEAHGYVSSKQLKKKTPGKPTRVYSLNKDLCNLTLCGANTATKLSFKPSEHQLLLLQTFLVPLEDQYWLQKLLFTHEHLFDDAAIGYVRSEKDEIHLLVITQNVDAYRKQYAHIILNNAKDKRKVISWSHTAQEAKEGMERKEAYFLDLFKNCIVIKDSQNIINELKNVHLK